LQRLTKPFVTAECEMPKAFISYRQLNDDERKRVRTFAERLRACSVDVVLDQFYLDDHPAGPGEGWEKWSSDSALNSDYVLIIGTEAWFQCFDKTQLPGTGLGAACEAGGLRHRIYKANGIIENIRVVVFDESDARFVSGMLEPYHRFHADRDLANIVRWLGGVPLVGAVKDRVPITSISNNLPRLQPFFGRDNELNLIRKALDPKSRTWGTLIDGDGGKGKTALAVRAAYDCPPENFDQIAFVSLKQQEQDDSKLRKLGAFALSSWMQMLNEIARILSLPDVAKASEEERALKLRNELSNRRVLLVLDNLETLSDSEQDQLFTFLEFLPSGCKGLLTSRTFAGNKLLAIDLPKLDQSSALEMLAEIAQHNQAFAVSEQADRIRLYEQTKGNALLLRWVAGQVGSGDCSDIADALAHLAACPSGNDPLAYIFESVVKSLGDQEIRLLAMLTWPSQPIPVEAIAEIVDVPVADARRLLKILTNRSLVIPDQEAKQYALVQMVAHFLRKHRPVVVREAGELLEDRAYTLIIEKGHEHEYFPLLDAAWPTIAPALPLLVAGPNDRLQAASDALRFFFEFTGRWDEWISLEQSAEAKAVAAEDHLNAGWRIFQIGWVHYLRLRGDDVIACAERAKEHWEAANAGTRERSTAIRLRGLGYRLNKDYPAAVAAFRESLDLRRALSPESKDVASVLNDLAGAERLSGDFEAAEQDYLEALRVGRRVNFAEGVAAYTSNLATLAEDREDWQRSETLVREGLALSEALGRLELIAWNCRGLAKAVMRQGRNNEALPYALRAVEIYTKLNSPEVAGAQATLRECETRLQSETEH
jgi:tetratricopeptide (TPR) repeat protein